MNAIFWFALKYINFDEHGKYNGIDIGHNIVKKKLNLLVRVCNVRFEKSRAEQSQHGSFIKKLILFIDKISVKINTIVLTPTLHFNTILVE